MIDSISAIAPGLTAIAPGPVALIFFAGLATSVGPCVAPRYVAIAAIVNGYRRPLIPTAVFVAGLIGGFAALGFGAGLLGSAWRFSPLFYGILAGSLVIGGALTLARAGSARCDTSKHGEEHTCAAGARAAGRRRSLGAVFILGAASALIVSPCCTPVVASIVATTTAIGKPELGIVLLASFGLGHAAPLFFAGSLASLVRRTFAGVAEQAGAVVSGSLMIALGAYYGILA